MIEIDASTPLTHDEQNQLLLSYITTRDELNAAEQANIIKAHMWAKKLKKSILSENMLITLHKKMFCDVWKWAGKYRRTERNIGIDAYRVPMEISLLLSDVSYWIKNETYPFGEIAARFHHKLVYIHPFPNGNGRFSRLSTDILLIQMGLPPFQWGNHLDIASQRRQSYVKALRSADEHDINPLLNFLRVI